MGQSDFAWVTVRVFSRPSGSITSPIDGQRFGTNSSLSVFGRAFDYDGSVTNLGVYVDGALYAQTNNGAFNFTWSTNTVGWHTFDAVATDNDGLTNRFGPVTIAITNSSTATNVITATIDNLSNNITTSFSGLSSTNIPVIREGFFDLQGKARDSHAGELVTYQVLLYRPEDNTDPDAGEFSVSFANVTPGPRDAAGFHVGGDNTNDLGILDLSGIPNGRYDMRLIVHGGGGEATASVRLQLSSQLKIGQFSFSEQDLVLPVNGIPLTVTRTYNSLNPRSADFGYSWTYTLNSMDVELDDVRQNVTIGSTEAPFADEEEDDNGLPKVVSIRTGGGWDVTLNLPGGRRTTFAFKPLFVPSECRAYARWKAPSDVHATLSALPGHDEINLIPFLPPYWQDGGDNSTFNNHDIPGWVLTDLDGTAYFITRPDPSNGTPGPNNVVWDSTGEGDFLNVQACGPPQLTSIVRRDGARIEITRNGIAHFRPGGTNAIRSVLYDRDQAGRIIAIWDPIAQLSESALPSVRYLYNQDNGNLIQVLKLVDRSAGTYITNKYHYDNPNFPHYITSMENPLGIPTARNEYDDDGRLTAVVDADGNRTEFVRSGTNRIEHVIDRRGFTNTTSFDLRGNVIASTNALGGITLVAYDDLNKMTNQVSFLNGQPYATNLWSYDPTNGLLLASCNPLGQSNLFSYNPNGQLLTAIDARGYGLTNVYDEDTGKLLYTGDALGNTTLYHYSNLGLLLSTTDPLGTVSANTYDDADNLVASVSFTSDLSFPPITNVIRILGTNSFDYDENGNRIRAVAWRRVNGTWTGATNSYVFDALNRVIQVVDANGGTNTIVYNETGRQARIVDVLGRETRYSYDDLGRLTETVYPDGFSESSVYDSKGNRTVTMDKLRRQTFYLYDPLNRLTNTVFTDNSSARTIYDDIGRVISTVDDRGVTNAFGYDAAGRRFAVTNALGATEQMVSTFGFDSNGNETYLTNALGIVTTNVFDPLNRQVGVLYPDGTSAFFGLDASGRRVSKTNQDGVITLFAYDGAGRLTSVTNAFGTTEQMVTRYDYDEAGNLVHQIDALNRTNAFSYDALRRRISHSMPDTNLVERFGYDIAGRLLYHTNFNGMVVTNEFNEMNRLTNQMSVQGYRASYAYSPTGHRTNMTDLSGTTRYSYDARDRLTNKVVSWTQGPSLTLSYVYDTCGSLTRLWSDSSGGVTNFYEHDALGRLTNVVTRDGGGASYGFDPLGNVQTIRFRNSVTNVQWYDALSRLTNSLWKLNTNTLASFSYILAPGGTRTNLSELLNGTNYTYAWAYDRLYRLKQESLGGATSGTLSYGFDRVSNRTNRTVSGSPGLTNQTATFDSKDRLASDSYDDNGNTTSSAGNVYLYDPLNHATNVNSGSVVIEYDGDGNRVTRTTGGTTTYYLTDDRNPSGYAQTIEEWVGSPGGTNLLRVYNYGLELLSQEQLGVSTNYFILDGHGSTRALANASGAIVNTFVFDAYGNILRSNTASQTPYLYLCQRYDADVGTYHLRARTYNPNSGRFLTSDPYSGNLNDPLTLHKYLYANCDPVNGADRSGYLVEEELETEAIGEEIETDSALSVSEMEVKGLDKIGTAFLTGALLLGTALFVTGDTAEQAEPEPVPQIPDQKEFKAYQDPTLDFGVEGHCVQYAEKIDKKKRTSGRALFIAYRLKLPYNINVYSPWGSILDRIAGRNVSENGFHVGWIRKGKVYDNWYSGIPMLAWPSLYEVIRPIVGPDGNVTGPTTFATLGQAHMEGFGQLKLFKDSPPQSRYDERWNSEGGDVINMQNFEQ